MIDVESAIFTEIATALRDTFTGIFVSGEYVQQPSQFPAVSIVEMDNSTYQPGIDSSGIENFANLMYQVDVYSNRTRGKKAECKAIVALIDEYFSQMGFVRTYMNPVQNMNDASIYRMTGRYQSVVGKDEYTYRR